MLPLPLGSAVLAAVLAVAAPPVGRDPVLAHRAAARRGGGPAWLRAEDADGERALRALGLRAPRHVWVAADLGAGALQTALSAGPGLAVAAAPALRLQSRASLAAIGAADLAVPAAVPDGGGGGAGVLVGLVDTGIDLDHPAFRDAAGRSRVVAIWDQDHSGGPAPVPFGYGQLCDAQTIAAGQCRLSDAHGHGTHVAAIAAGTLPAPGVAPAADLAVVRSAGFTRLADAVAFLVQLADARDQPLVVNISVGGQYGPHDGRTPLEDALDAQVGPGRVLVAAAGNDGADRIHLATSLTAAGARVVLEGLPRAPGTDAIVEFWAALAADVQIAAELWIDGAPVATAPLSVAVGGQVVAALAYRDATYAEFTATHTRPSGHHQARHALVVDRSRAPPLPRGGRLVLRLAGQGDVHAWISQTDYASGAARFGATRAPGWLAGDGVRSIAVPATAFGVIAVGSYTLANQWRSYKDGTQALPGLRIGDLSPFSSVGPSGQPHTTGTKPDLTAPGGVIVSARAGAVAPGPEVVDATTMVMQGTSMAAPHVTGTVALMLAEDGGLTPQAVRDVLRQTARADHFTGPVPNAAWGHGKLAAAAAVGQVVPAGDGCAQAPPVTLPWALGMLVLRHVGRRVRGRRRG